MFAKDSNRATCRTRYKTIKLILKGDKVTYLMMGQVLIVCACDCLNNLLFKILYETRMFTFLVRNYLNWYNDNGDLPLWFGNDPRMTPSFQLHHTINLWWTQMVGGPVKQSTVVVLKTNFYFQWHKVMFILNNDMIMFRARIEVFQIVGCKWHLKVNRNK